MLAISRRADNVCTDNLMMRDMHYTAHAIAENALWRNLAALRLDKHDTVYSLSERRKLAPPGKYYRPKRINLVADYVKVAANRARMANRF
jgi:hypothetical protein